MDRKEKDADANDEDTIEAQRTALLLWAQVLGNIF
jgi:hypothetical protein